MPQLSEIRNDILSGGRLSSITRIEEEPSFQNVDESSIFDGLPDWIKSGYNESITGLGHKLITGETPFDLEGYHPSVLEDIGASVVSFLMPTDWLTFGGFAKAGKAVFNASQMATKQMVKAGVKKSTAEQIAGKGAAKVMKDPSMKALVAEGATTGAFGLGGYTGVATAMRQMAEEEGLDLGEVLKQTGKSAVLGAVTGGIGGRAVKKGTSELVKASQETLAFGGLGALLEGEDPFDPMSYVHSAGVILGMKGARGTFTAAGRIRRGEPIIQPKLEQRKITPKEVEKISKIELDVLNVERRLEEVWTKKAGKQKSVRIVKDRTDESGKKFFRLEDLKTGESFEIQKQIFFKAYELTEKGLTPKQIESGRVRDIKILERKLNINEKKSQVNKRLIMGVDDASKRISLKDFTPKQLFQYRKKLQNIKELGEIKEKYKDEFVDYQPEKHWMEKVFPANVVKPLFSVTNRVRAKESKILLNKVDVAIERTEQIAGSFLEKISFESGLSKLSKKEAIEVADALSPKEAQGRKVSKRAREAAKKIRKPLTDIFKLADKTGIKVGKFEKDFYPRIRKTKVSEIMYNDLLSLKEKTDALWAVGVSKKEVKMLNGVIKEHIAKQTSKETKAHFKYMVEELNMSYKDAFDRLIVDLHNENVRPYGNLEKERTLKFPSSFYERDANIALAQYVTKVAKRIANVEVFGTKGEGATSLVKSVALKDPAEARVIQNTLDAHLGVLETKKSKNFSPRIKKFLENLMGFEMATKIALGFATIPNAFQFAISIAPKAGYSRLFRGAYQLKDENIMRMIRKSGATKYNLLDVLMGTDLSISSPKKLADTIRAIGRDRNNRMHNVASVLATVTGFKPMNYVNQLLAASTGEVFVRDLKKIVDGKSSFLGAKRRRSWAIMNLKKLGIKDPTKAITNEMMEHAMFRFARETQLQRSITNEPMFFHDPRFRPFIMFKRFGWMQSKLVKDLLKDEVRSGNVLVPLRFAIGGLAGAEFVMWGKDKLMRMLSGEDVFREDKQGWDKFIDKMAAIGSVGMLSDIVDAEDKLRAVEFIATPVLLSDTFQLFKGLQGLTYNVDTFGFGKDAIVRSIKGFAPIGGGIFRQVAKRAETPGQKEKRISVRKGRIRTKIFKAMLEGRHKEAYGNINNWNKANPTNPFTADDINFSEIYQYVARKNRIKAKP